ncbi:protein kinase domain-containing protein [Metarhizium acridum CQMa 102]|uniref:non-specific serine/threonine protein kinase n=1 Tax=Metarhizium acridum (strain CQMa 102) TaxID=655827 RepID=E9ED66_METAQ|nr:protein kinase domain-containing protein [Metarhizium acridum CQMa 102]EFY86149.1 protein kinase domain-containing protein [Metarhizium acridum CQMa 102]
MASLLKWARAWTRRAPLVPLRFPTSGFDLVQDPVLLEEEQLDGFAANQYYPINIGDVLASRYQVIGKLGFGTTSTVWLARNLITHGHVALKVYTRDRGNQEEFQVLETLGKANPSHPGYRHVRAALDIFQLHRPGGDHYCLVQRPMWESWKHLLRRNPTGRFTEPLLKAGLRHLFSALDYLHSECKLVHTGKSSQ